MAKLTVISPGPLSTIQDEGRFGYMSTGFSPSGAMDVSSMKMANILVGNAPGDGVIEMTFMGMTAQFDCTTVIALTGADMHPAVNGKNIDMYAAVEVHAGDVLTLKAATKGMRTYLAVAQGFAIPPVMGSMSTNLKCGLGGFQGRRLEKGDEIPLRQSIPLSFVGDRRMQPDNEYPSLIRVRVILGPQEEYFTEKGIETFLSTEYTVSDKSDRMGVRLEGMGIENKNGVDIISDGIVTGSVQVPASGMPIILMADRQTTGGYAKLATVISADLPKIAQARPGNKICFEAVSGKEAIKLLRKQERARKALEYKTMYM